MDHLWIICFPAAVCAILAPVIWGVWGTELCIWLIPAAEIQSDAKDFVRLHGLAAEREAMKRSIEAWSRSDLLNAGRWDRVVVALYEAARRNA